MTGDLFSVPDHARPNAQLELDLIQLKHENQRLIALLAAHGVDWRLQPNTRREAEPETQAEPTQISTTQKLALFRRVFRGRQDIYPVRWESKTSSRSGYAPACAHEWVAGVCEKPRIKCSDCPNRELLPVTDGVIYAHLKGQKTVGVYPLLEDDTCYFLAIDFDDADWKEDANGIMQSAQELGVPAALEVSRSGQGAHIWVFFSSRVMARDARRLGTALISHTCHRIRQLKLTSYDRLLPNQDTMPKGGFGNLIALPLQKRAREAGNSVFVRPDLTPYLDQWVFLKSIKPMDVQDIEPTILRAMGGTHPLDVTFIEDEDLDVPWKKTTLPLNRLAGKMPATLNVTLANQIFFEKEALPQSLANRLIRLAAFQNPGFYKAQAMRKSVWDQPRVIGCAENYPRHIGLPRGCLEAALALLHENDIASELRDQRVEGNALDVTFQGTLRLDQEAAVAGMLRHEFGVLCAPTAFGKTVTAAAIVARRKKNTLILVHRTELLKQWQERLQTFLGVDKDIVGAIGGGKSRPTGQIDIAIMQSICRLGRVDPLVDSYGQIIIDECHHVGATSFEAILKQAKAKFVLGLTATPVRRDGQQPIIFMQCGPIRYKAATPANAPHDLTVIPSYRHDRVAVDEKQGFKRYFGIWRRMQRAP